MSALAVVPLDEVEGRLVAFLRPEFDVAVFRPDPDDPVLAGDRCAVGACDRPARSRGMCAAHRSRWVQQGRPDPARFAATAGPVRAGRPRADEVFDLSTLPTRCRLELALVLQRRHDERGRGLRPLAVRPVVAMLAASGVDSLLDRSLDAWVAALPPGSRTNVASATGFLRYAWRHVEAIVGGGGAEGEYARDRWDARRLGVPVTVGHHSVSFERIPQPWLRTAVKGWARARLVGGMSFGAIRRDTTAMSWFAGWLADAHPGASGAAALTRATLESYLAHLTAHGPVPNTRLGYLTSLRGFLETARRRGWLDLPAGAVFYHDDLPRRPAGLPRFVPEDQMAQLESAYLPFVQGRAKVMHQEHCDIVDLLGPDRESTHLEYKATLRTHADGGEVFKPLETASLKTIAAFMNSRTGGTLLIGVADDGTVHGLESDYVSRSKKEQDPRDWFQQHLANIIATSMGEAAATNVRPQIHHVDGGDLCRVQVDPAAFPIDAKVIVQKPGGPKETRTEFFVRVANGTRALDAIEREKYIMGRWGG